MPNSDALRDSEPEQNIQKIQAESGQDSEKKGFENIFANLSEEDLQSYLEHADKDIKQAEQYAEVRKQQAILEGNREIERRKKIKEALENLLAKKESQKNQ